MLVLQCLMASDEICINQLEQWISLVDYCFNISAVMSVVLLCFSVLVFIVLVFTQLFLCAVFHCSCDLLETPVDGSNDLSVLDGSFQLEFTPFQIVSVIILI